ncbi:MAG: glycoside hydrolase family 88 protein [Lachnospirales bacterium]
MSIIEENSKWIDETIKKIRTKMDWVSEKNRNKLPYTTDENGNYNDFSDGKEYRLDSGINWWTNGFWGGLMWLLYLDTKEEKYMDIANICEEKLEHTFDIFFGLHHDVGFMFQLTSVANFQITKNENSKKNGMHAANLLAGRFNPIGNYIRAWNDHDGNLTSGWAIIDCMLNISLLFWASKESNDPRFKHIGMLHADTVAKSFIRENGSVNHIVEFNSETGEVVKTYGGQGYENGSSWTRGQSWAIYGFTNTYIHTSEKRYLDTAIKVADYCIFEIDETFIIPVDFKQPKEVKLEDSCGAVIIVSGLIELSKYVDERRKEKYLNYAINILKVIVEKRSDWSEDCDAIVKNCTGAYHSKESHHITMNYADYYFVEAIYKLKGIGKFMW